MDKGLTDNLVTALLAVQGEMPALQKNSINPHFKSKYISLDALTEAVFPILNRHGLVWLALPVLLPSGESGLNYRLIHQPSGESINETMPLMPAKADPQGQGSAITYARRYSLMAVLGLVADEDDDGNAAQGYSKPPQPQSKPRGDEIPPTAYVHAETSVSGPREHRMKRPEQPKQGEWVDFTVESIDDSKTGTGKNGPWRLYKLMGTVDGVPERASTFNGAILDYCPELPATIKVLLSEKQYGWWKIQEFGLSEFVPNEDYGDLDRFDVGELGPPISFDDNPLWSPGD